MIQSLSDQGLPFAGHAVIASEPASKSWAIRRNDAHLDSKVSTMEPLCQRLQ